MLQRAIYWLFAVSLVTHSLSITIGMSSAHAYGIWTANGIWTVSCAGKPMLLLIPGDTGDSTPMSHCLYCNCDSPETLTTKGTSLPLHRLGNTQSLIAPTTTHLCHHNKACHPTRAPPAIH